MPRLSCWRCGRQIYTVAPLEALFAEERRCPRCGAFLRTDRRETERRVDHRRKNPQHDPGPPKPEAPPTPKLEPSAAAKPKPGPTAGLSEADAADDERRLAERRTARRRGSGGSKESRPASGSSDRTGSQD
jgi:hypothetical protein